MVKIRILVSHPLDLIVSFTEIVNDKSIQYFTLDLIRTSMAVRHLWNCTCTYTMWIAIKCTYLDPMKQYSMQARLLLVRCILYTCALSDPSNLHKTIYNSLILCDYSIPIGVEHLVWFHFWVSSPFFKWAPPFISELPFFEWAPTFMSELPICWVCWPFFTWAPPFHTTLMIWNTTKMNKKS